MAVLDSDGHRLHRALAETARQGQREIDLNLHIGSRLPAYCTSAQGKVLLANLPEDELRDVLEWG